MIYDSDGSSEDKTAGRKVRVKTVDEVSEKNDDSVGNCTRWRPFILCSKK